MQTMQLLKVERRDWVFGEHLTQLAEEVSMVSWSKRRRCSWLLTQATLLLLVAYDNGPH